MSGPVNPVTVELIRNALIAVADEMNATLIRSAYTPIIYEMKDCSVALLDSEHRVLGQSAGLPIFLGNLEACTIAIEEQYGRDVWAAGDVWIMNDPYVTGTHLHDMTVMEPIFDQSSLIGFAASRAHWLDVGSKDPGGTIDSTDVFQEGLRLEREFISSIPDGTYQAEGSIDSDGVNDREVFVQVEVTVDGQDMVIDLSGSDDACEGPVNCGASQAIAAARVAYKLLVDPSRPANGGSFRPLSVKVRDGSVVGAKEPFPVEWYFTPLGLLIDLVVKALSEAVPERAAAASYGDSMVIYLSGTHPDTKQPWLHVEPTVGGWGAWNGSDGEDGLINNVNGSLKDMPIEVLETKYPVRLRHYGYRTDSCGHGRFRGGVGVEREFEILADASMSAWFERSRTPAWGLAGGWTAEPPDIVLNPGRPDESHFLKCANVRLSAGDIIRTKTGGGGGFGDPADRDSSAVRADVADVADGVITPEIARDVYGLADPSADGSGNSGPT